MSRVELPLGLRDRVFGRRHEGRLDEATADRVERALHGLEPDVFFRRRLRGAIVNYYVAHREGHIRRERPKGRQMGTVGRSVLYASFALALGVTAAGAASQDSLPGDVLYPVKLRLEEVRLYIAPPSLRDDLLALALDQRLDELQALVDRGSWTLVAAAAERVAQTEATLEATDPGASEAGEHADDVLESLLATAPAAARPGIERALGGDPPGQVKEPPGQANEPAGSGSPEGDSKADPTPKPEATQKPEATAKPHPTQRPR